MANLADCWISFRPMSPAFASDVRERIASRGGASPDAVSVETTDGVTVRLDFFAKWECGFAWEVIDELLADDAYPFRAELLACEINGRGTEPGCGYREGVKKFATRARLLRKSR